MFDVTCEQVVVHLLTDVAGEPEAIGYGKGLHHLPRRVVRMAPDILEEVYTMEDALAFGGACISLLNHADRVKAACLAQLVNVIAPIMTETGGPAWRQTIFWPFAQWSNHGRGRVLRATVDCPSYDANYYDPRGPQDLYFPVARALPEIRCRTGGGWRCVDAVRGEPQPDRGYASESDGNGFWRATSCARRSS